VLPSIATSDAKQNMHAKGKPTARERIYALLDYDSFVELDALARHRSSSFGLAENRPLGDGVVTGCGTIDWRRRPHQLPETRLRPGPHLHRRHRRSTHLDQTRHTRLEPRQDQRPRA
jgi:hypothetical protein